jgi:hypothetical protein
MRNSCNLKPENVSNVWARSLRVGVGERCEGQDRRGVLEPLSAVRPQFGTGASGFAPVDWLLAEGICALTLTCNSLLFQA